MRLSTVFISSAFVLAGMSAALPVERGNMLVARFADSDFLAEVEARAYDEEPELYARGTVASKVLTEHNRGSRAHSALSRTSSHPTASRNRPPTPPSSRMDTNYDRPSSPFTAAQQRSQMSTGLSGTTLKPDFSGTTLTQFRSSPRRRSFYEMPPNELTRRGVRTWVKNGYSKVTGFFGGSGATAPPTGDGQ